MPSAPSPRRFAQAWRIGDRKTALLLLFLLPALAAWSSILVAAVSQRIEGSNPPGDFFALWSWGRFALTHPLAQIYDAAALHDFQLGLDPISDLLAPYPYPPQFAVLLVPLSLIDRNLAFALWCLTTLALYLVAVGGGWRVTVATLILPTTSIALVAGQNGFLTAALMIGGLRLARTGPLLAGMLFGLLAYKPQFGLLVPIALLAAGLWRVIAAATVTVLLQAAALTVAFGWDIWGAWIGFLRGHFGVVTAAMPLDRIMPTVTSGVLMLGGSPALARAVQAAVAVVVAILVWRCFRRGNFVLSAAALQVGAFLATPYALAYDLPIAGSALIAVLVQPGAEFVPLEVSALIAAAILPIGMTMPNALLPYGTIGVALLFAVIVRRALTSRMDSYTA